MNDQENHEADDKEEAQMELKNNFLVGPNDCLRLAVWEAKL